jgi:hypothetical protein
VLVLVVPDDDDDEDEDEFYREEEDEDEDEEDYEDEDEEDVDKDKYDKDEDEEGEYDEDEDYKGEDEDEDEFSVPFSTPSHWPPQITRQRTPLLHLIHSHLVNHFTASPSLQLYQVLSRLSPPTTTTTTLTNTTANADTEKKEINAILDAIATSSSDTFVAALDIHSHSFLSVNPWRADRALYLASSARIISSLLTSHSHLLRPCDAPTLQKAISLLASLPPNYNPANQNQNQNTKYTLQALRILEKEMIETALALRTSLLPLFSGLSDVDKCTSEMGIIVRMRAASAARVDRVERWVDGVSTPRVGGDANEAGQPPLLPPPHPMALAAFMMGLPVFPGALAPDDMDEEDAGVSDPFGYLYSLDSNSVDLELEDLRDEFRPRIKERFDGWVEVGSVMPGVAGVLLRVYIKILGLMPFFRAGDVVDEIISRYVTPYPFLRCC